MNNLVLFYDTETTGLPLFKEPSEHPDQPHIVQLAAALVDTDTRKTVSSIDVIIKPDGWTIPEETIEIHGISNELANDVGIPLHEALDIFLWRFWNERIRVAHNQSFDARMIRIAQHQIECSEDSLELWKNGEKFCTMWESKKYTQLPKNKHPRLEEAYRHFFGVDFENAHNAMADVNACIAVYFAIKDMDKTQ